MSSLINFLTPIPLRESIVLFVDQAYALLSPSSTGDTLFTARKVRLICEHYLRHFPNSVPLQSLSMRVTEIIRPTVIQHPPEMALEQVLHQWLTSAPSPYTILSVHDLIIRQLSFINNYSADDQFLFRTSLGLLVLHHYKSFGSTIEDVQAQLRAINVIVGPASSDDLRIQDILHYIFLNRIPTPAETLQALVRLNKHKLSKEELDSVTERLIKQQQDCGTCLPDITWSQTLLTFLYNHYRYPVPDNLRTLSNPSSDLLLPEQIAISDAFRNNSNNLLQAVQTYLRTISNYSDEDQTLLEEYLQKLFYIYCLPSLYLTKDRVPPDCCPIYSPAQIETDRKLLIYNLTQNNPILPRSYCTSPIGQIYIHVLFPKGLPKTIAACYQIHSLMEQTSVPAGQASATGPVQVDKSTLDPLALQLANQSVYKDLNIFNIVCQTLDELYGRLVQPLEFLAFKNTVYVHTACKEIQNLVYCDNLDISTLHVCGNKLLQAWRNTSNKPAACQHILEALLQLQNFYEILGQKDLFIQTFGEFQENLRSFSS